MGRFGRLRLSLRSHELVGAVLMLAGFVLVGLGWWQRSWPMLAASLVCGVFAAGLLAGRINGRPRPQPDRSRTVGGLAVDAGQPRPPSELVWVGKRVRRYHLEGCAVLGNSASTITRSEAVDAGLPGCEICGSSN